MNSVTEHLPYVSHGRGEQLKAVVARYSRRRASYVVLSAPVDHHTVGVSYLGIVETMRAVVEYGAFAIRADGVHEDFGGPIGKFSLHRHVVAVIRDVTLSTSQTDAAVLIESVEHVTTDAVAGNDDLGQSVGAGCTPSHAHVGDPVHHVFQRRAPTPSRTTLPGQSRGGNQNVALHVGDVPVRVEIQQRHHAVVG